MIKECIKVGEYRFSNELDELQGVSMDWLLL